MEGRFKFVTASGTYRYPLGRYEKQTVTATEVIGDIGPQLVQAGKLKSPRLCIFNCDLLRLYEPDAFTDLEEHNQELTDLSPTEREELRKARIGQGTYRKKLLALWKTCAVTG